MEVSVVIANQGISRSPTVATHGVDTATSQGTTIDPGATPSTKGVWVELAASTAAQAKWLTVDIGNNLNAAATTAVWFLDIGTGVAESEAVYIPTGVEVERCSLTQPMNDGLLQAASAGSHVTGER
jgi:hypothetical protein